MSRMLQPGARLETRAVAWVTAGAAAFVASVGLIGADALWAVPLGARIAHGHLPGSVPFATATTSGWRDVPAAGELIVWALYHGLGGARGVLALQAVSAAIGLGGLAFGLARASRPGTALAVSLLTIAGSLPALVDAGIPAFSLALFPLLVVLLETESREPSRRIWLAVPLLAAWGNLHGGVLAGWALLACYLAFDRSRSPRRAAPAEAALVLTAATAALLANPALWHTATYYRRVFESVPARSGTALWSPLRVDLGGVLLVAVLLVFLGLALKGRARVRLWEAVALAGLAAATVHVERTGTWLLFAAAYPVARSVELPGPKPRLLVAAAAALALATLAGLAPDPLPDGSQRLARAAAATHEPVLANPVLGEEVAIAGGRVWVDDPIDAFGHDDQRLYLDWLAGKPAGRAAVRQARYVLVDTGSAAGIAAAHDLRLTLLERAGDTALYRVRRSLS
jgi:hypothetical protein